MATKTPKYRMIDGLMGGKLAETLERWDAERISAEEMSARLYADHKVIIHGHTLRRWLRDSSNGAVDKDEKAS